MQHVLRAIERQRANYFRLPLFEFMNDSGIPAARRLAFYPCMAHFIMSFGDLNRYVLRQDAAGDRYQELINVHTSEDANHWQWYLDDLTKLGFDRTMTSSEWLRFLWSDRSCKTRLLTLELAHLVFGATTLERLVIIEAIEVAGNAFFSRTAELSRLVQNETGTHLQYYGDYHLERETGHTIGANKHEIESIQLDERQRKRSLALAARVAELFENWSGELLEFARTEQVPC